MITHNVKVPFTQYSVSPMLNSNKVVSTDNESTNETVYPDLMEYGRLKALTKDLPSDLFVDQLLIDYSYSTDKLENTRHMLFETLRSSEDFPFGEHCEMKRRVMTRSKNGSSSAPPFSFPKSVASSAWSSLFIIPRSLAIFFAVFR